MKIKKINLCFKGQNLSAKAFKIELFDFYNFDIQMELWNYLRQKVQKWNSQMDLSLEKLVFLTSIYSVLCMFPL